MFKASQNLKPLSIDFGLLIIRVAAGGLMLLHGAPKLFNFTSRWHKFSDPLGIGPELTFILCVFAEFFCAVFLMVGAFSRLVVIPLIINMLVIVFIVHGGDPLKERETALFFLSAYTMLFLTGPGKFSLDGMRR
jgi:putative oxidoreductase